jgi:hypothetical protein
MGFPDSPWVNAGQDIGLRNPGPPRYSTDDPSRRSWHASRNSEADQAW